MLYCNWKFQLGSLFERLVISVSYLSLLTCYVKYRDGVWSAPLRRNIRLFVVVKFNIFHFNAWFEFCETLCIWKHCKSSHLFFINGHIFASNAQVTFKSLPHHLPPASFCLERSRRKGILLLCKIVWGNFVHIACSFEHREDLVNYGTMRRFFWHSVMLQMLYEQWQQTEWAEEWFGVCNNTTSTNIYGAWNYWWFIWKQKMNSLSLWLPQIFFFFFKAFSQVSFFFFLESRVVKLRHSEVTWGLKKNLIYPGTIVII